MNEKELRKQFKEKAGLETDFEIDWCVKIAKSHADQAVKEFAEEVEKEVGCEFYPIQRVLERRND